MVKFTAFDMKCDENGNRLGFYYCYWAQFWTKIYINRLQNRTILSGNFENYIILFDGDSYLNIIATPDI